MKRLLLISIAGLVLLLFAWSNTHHVELGLIIGGPTHVRLVFLLLTMFLLGNLNAVLLNAYLRYRTKTNGRGASKAEDEHEDQDDKFFLE